MTTSASQLPWLPLAKAAEKVSELTGKHHSKADIIDAALAGHLSLSVHLISPVFARSGHFQDYAEDAPHGISTSVSLLCAENGISSEKSALLELLGIKDGIFAYSSDEGEYVQGLLDLVLIGNGKAHLQNLERKIRGECGGYFLPSGGIYLKGPTGIFWELQEQLDNSATRSDDHEIEHTPAERFREDWRIVVRPSELERLLSFHEKPLPPTPPVDVKPTTAPPAAEHQATGPVLIGSTYYTGRKEIMAALGVSDWKTVKRYMKTGLVVTHNPAGKPQTTQEEIDKWRASSAGKAKK